VSAVMPYLFILSLAVGLLIITLVAGALEQLGTRTIVILGRPQLLDVLSSELLYLTGVVGEIFLLTAVYLVMPVGRLSFRHALIGGTAAALLWEITRHFLVWYFSTISQIQLVYGSLTTAIAVLLSVEVGAIVLLLGAQVIAEYERIGHEPIAQRPAPMKADKA
jgi:YihY family inner membrane protein